MKARVFRGIVLLALVGGVSGAYAADIDLQSIGVWSNQTSPQFSTTQNVIYQWSDVTLPSLTSMYFEVPIVTGNGEAADGYFTNGTDSFTFNAVINNIDTVGSSQSGEGTWTLTSDTGAFSQFVSGAGTFSLTINLTGNNQAAFSAFTGTLNPVPEPMTLGAFAIGAIGLLARRRRA